MPLDDADVTKIILDSLARLEDKSDRLSVRMDRLVDTTNHRLDDFREAMSLHRLAVDAQVAKKADQSTLLTSIGFTLLQNKFVRWAVGVATVSVAATATYEHWFEVVAGWFN